MSQGASSPVGKELIVAIDGPSGAGKSTISRLLSQALGYINIDTGAMYRAVALAARRRGLAADDCPALGALARNLRLEFIRRNDHELVLLDGEDVSEAIRTPENSLFTSQVAACPQVRTAMVALQRQMGDNGGVVLEGRDIGTVVFPGAEVKVFLLASARERGRRRYEELLAKGLEVDLEQTIREVEARDAADEGRTHAPLVRAEDAIPVDTSGLSIEQVLKSIVELVQAKRRELGFCQGKRA